MTSKIKNKIFSQVDCHQATVCKVRYFDIALIFNLIVECCEHGYINSAFLALPYQAGLVLQLISVWLLGKIPLSYSTWDKAALHVIRYEGEFAGFIFMRYLVPSGASQEVFMCAIEAKYRRSGLARRLIQSVLFDFKDNCIVKASCLPKAWPMKCLLRHMGFKSIKVTHNNSVEWFQISWGIEQEKNYPALPAGA